MSRRGVETDSLDLLLDTICNMFGGIVLIAILLAIVSQAAGKATRAVRDPESRQSQEQTVAEQAQQIELLKTQIEALSRADSAPEGADADAVARLQNAVDALEQRIAALQSQAERETERVAGADSAQEGLERLIAERQAHLAALKSMRRRTLHAPRLREVHGMEPVLCAFQHGRFYPINDFGRQLQGGQRRDYDASHVRVQKQPLIHQVKLLEAAGQPVGPGCEFRGPVRDMLRNVDRDKEFLNVFLFSDSYAAFNYLKPKWVEKGYRYNWVGMGPDDEIQIRFVSHVDYRAH